VTWLAIVLALFGLLGWRLAYMWWAVTKAQTAEVEALQTQVAELLLTAIDATEEHTNEIRYAQSLIFQQALSGKIGTGPRA